VFSQLSSALKNPLRRKTIRGAPIIVVAGTVAAAAQIAGSQRFNNVWTP
jgi:hypothetical protein